MKKAIQLLWLVLIVAMSIVAYGQSYYSIPKTGSPSGYIYDNSGFVIMEQPANDSLSPWVFIPFTWNFYGSPVTGFHASDNGYITFDVNATTSDPANVSIPDPTGPNQAIYAFWDDLDLQSGGGAPDEIRRWTYGASPNRTMVIQWYSVTPGGQSTSPQMHLYAAILLHEGGDFDIVYSWGGPSIPTMTATVGCEDTSGTDATQLTGSPNFDYPLSGGPDASDDVMYSFVYGTQPDYDLTVVSNTMDPFLPLANAPFTITGVIENFGLVSVTDFDLHYTVDGGSTVTGNISGVTLNTFGNYTFTHPTDWTPTAGGTYIIDIWADNINSGNVDQNTSNDKNTRTIQVVDEVIPRVVLHENFTGSTCGPCFNGNIVLNGVLALRPNKYTLVAYHMSWPVPGDPYYTLEGNTRKTYYGVSGIPNARIDGGWGGNPQSYTTAIFDSYSAVPSFMEINATHEWVGKTLKVYVDVKAYEDYNSSNMKVHIVAHEIQTFNNAKSNGETVFDNVMKKMLPDQDGTSIPAISKGNTETISSSWAVQGIYRLPLAALDGGGAYIGIDHTIENSIEDVANIAVVVWVQDNLTKEVFQSTNSSMISGINGEHNKGNGITSLYPNPASDFVNLNFNLSETQNVTVNVYSVLGDLVYSKNNGELNRGHYNTTLNVSNMAAGIYMLQLNIDNHIYSKKFNVVD